MTLITRYAYFCPLWLFSFCMFIDRDQCRNTEAIRKNGARKSHRVAGHGQARGQDRREDDTAVAEAANVNRKSAAVLRTIRGDTEKDATRPATE